MPTVVVAVAEAVKDALNAASLSQPFEAVRAYVAVYDVRDVGGLKVTVVPVLLTVTAIDLNNRLAFEWEIGVWVQKRAGLTPAEVDPLMALAEEIVDLFRGWRPNPTTRCVRIETRPVLSPDRHDTQGVFTTVVTLTVRVTR